MLCKVWYVTHKQVTHSDPANVVIKDNPWLRDRIRIKTPSGAFYVFKCLKFGQDKTVYGNSLTIQYPGHSCFQKEGSRFMKEIDPQETYDKFFKMHAEYLGEWDFGKNLFSNAEPEEDEVMLKHSDRKISEDGNEDF